jgi:hypothetical protein
MLMSLKEKCPNKLLVLNFKVNFDQSHIYLRTCVFFFFFAEVNTFVSEHTYIVHTYVMQCWKSRLHRCHLWSETFSSHTRVPYISVLFLYLRASNPTTIVTLDNPYTSITFRMGLWSCWFSNVLALTFSYY